ncbi:glycosyltransferase family 1 protein [Jeotgalibaca porci]|uniref:Glycosyltransferase family 1 protein n=1 Tax=Jeotgalibaca porci TaxID=1868793 RepID=A0A6G7WG44_9LACT|nr:glycosyltransferase [Jeotgalibaca porci]QIK51234.1 glycosyltransferase family 1 protein [Jeotgalibaca porci]
MKKIKVLHFINSLNYGGAERFLLNLLKDIDKDEFQMDIMVRNCPNDMAEDFANLDIKIIKAPAFPEKYFRHYKFMKKFVISRGHEYDIIHIHANSLIYTIPLSMFKKYARKTKIILHSHSSKSTSKLVTLTHEFNKKRYLKKIDEKLTVSKNAGKWMFNDQKQRIIYNGIDIELFKYNQRDRMKIRNELNINDNEILLGSVGRLVPVKNFELLLYILEYLNKKTSKKYKLVIVGQGELEKNLKDLAKKLNIDNQIIFTGQREDVASILSAMDVYLQPSHFEGLPFSVVESQVASLPTIISDKITDEVKISENLYFASNDNIDNWIDLIIKASKPKEHRIDKEKINTDKVDMKKIALKFEDIYKQLK